MSDYPKKAWLAEFIYRCRPWCFPRCFAVTFCGTAVLKNPKENLFQLHCVKSVQIRSFFWSVFYCIWTEYGDLRSKSEYGKLRTRKDSVFGHFSHSAVYHGQPVLLQCSLFILQTHHVYSTLQRHGNGRFQVVSTWNARGVFVRYFLFIFVNIRKSLVVLSFW